MAYKNYWRDTGHIEGLIKYWDEEDPAKRAPLYRCIHEIRGEGKTVLDVGCGTLQDYPFFKQEGWEYYGLEPSPEMILKAHQLYPEVTIMEADIVEARIKGGSFDLVNCMSVICHLPLGLVDLALENMARISRRHLCVSVPYIHDGPTISEDDPMGYIRNRFNAMDLNERINKFSKIRSMHREGDVVAILAEVSAK